ncbi:hypothetical protein M9Y10_041670 [Tritrichomonas musculus]|uniref:Uncharacterized protein n=1 Tax=Tritrichomonas musculus TaxID=1915356 RepID=A0ABR2K535_9EUKA
MKKLEKSSSPKISKNITNNIANLTSQFQQRSSRSRSQVSLENFEEDSKVVTFTEPESVEAIKRLGFSFSDFYYRSPLYFKRPGCDPSVTQLLYSKSEARRQEIIKEARAMREKVVEEFEKRRATLELKKLANQDLENSQDMQSMGLNSGIENIKARGVEMDLNSSIVRTRLKEVENEKKQLDEITRNRILDLKKLVVSQLRELFVIQKKKDAVERTNARMEKACKMKSEMILEAQKRANTLPSLGSPQLDPFNLQGSKNKNNQNSIDPHKAEIMERHIANALKRRKEEEEARLLKNKLLNEKRQDAYKRSIEITQQQKEKHLQKTVEEEEKFKKWQTTTHQSYLSTLQKKAEDRANHNRSVIANSIRIESDRIQREMNKIESSEKRSLSACQTYETELQQKLTAIRKRVDDRYQKCQDEQERNREKRELYRKKLDDDDCALKKRIDDMSKEITLKYVSRSFDRDVRVNKVHNKQAARDHMINVKYKEMQEAQIRSNELREEKLKFNAQKDNENRKFMSLKESVMNEFHRMDGPCDNLGLKRIQIILGIDDKEMQELINLAQEASNIENNQLMRSNVNKNNESSSRSSQPSLIKSQSPQGQKQVIRGMRPLIQQPSTSSSYNMRPKTPLVNLKK